MTPTELSSFLNMGDRLALFISAPVVFATVLVAVVCITSQAYMLGRDVYQIFKRDNAAAERLERDKE